MTKMLDINDVQNLPGDPQNLRDYPDWQAEMDREQAGRRYEDSLSDADWLAELGDALETALWPAPVVESGYEAHDALARMQNADRQHRLTRLRDAIYKSDDCDAGMIVRNAMRAWCEQRAGEDA